MASFEIIGKSRGPFLLTCEHASNRIPDAVSLTPGDRELLDQHWGWDIGARDVVEGLTTVLGGQAVVSRFSRLLVDPNRRPDSQSLIVREIDGVPLSFNVGLDSAEMERRLAEHFEPYHGAISAVGRQWKDARHPFALLAVHSFTPLYLGERRPMEVGVLFDDYDEDAWHLQNSLIEEGFEAALNAPYSGRDPAGLLYSAQRHGRSLGVKYLELEIRQDLIDDSGKAEAVAKRIARALEVFLPS